jgi:hypothetical protein
MLLVQNLMQEMLVDEEVVLNEDEKFTQVLGGKRSGHVRGMGKYVIPTPSSSHSRYGTQVNLELKETKLEVTKLSNQLLEKERKRDQQIEEMQNESNRRIDEIQKEANRHVEEIQKESKRQYDLLLSRILGKMVVGQICFVML